MVDKADTNSVCMHVTEEVGANEIREHKHDRHRDN